MSNVVKRDKSSERKEVDTSAEEARPKAASPAAKFFKSLMPDEAAEAKDVDKENIFKVKEVLLAEN